MIASDLIVVEMGNHIFAIVALHLCVVKEHIELGSDPALSQTCYEPRSVSKPLGLVTNAQ